MALDGIVVTSRDRGGEQLDLVGGGVDADVGLDTLELTRLIVHQRPDEHHRGT